MRFYVNHVADILYVTEQRQRARAEKTYQKETNYSVTWPGEGNVATCVCTTNT